MFNFLSHYRILNYVEYITEWHKLRILLTLYIQIQTFEILNMPIFYIEWSQLVIFSVIFTDTFKSSKPLFHIDKINDAIYFSTNHNLCNWVM